MGRRDIICNPAVTVAIASVLAPVYTRASGCIFPVVLALNPNTAFKRSIYHKVMYIFCDAKGTTFAKTLLLS